MPTIDEVRKANIEKDDPAEVPLVVADFEEWRERVFQTIARAVHYLGFDKSSGASDLEIATWIMEHRDGGCKSLEDILGEVY